ncbi:MAG: hypothetical protein HYV28_07935 [Ignavibacteriales bacterium]|nr:hypothetical protein [Ignavibacteriales bacterium]
MEENKVLDELQFIKKVIEDSKRALVDNGMGYIIWGLIVFAGMLSDYIEVSLYGRANSLIRWAILIGGGWLWTFVYYTKFRPVKSAKTFTGRLVGYLWMCAGISMTIIGFVATLSGMIRGMAVSPLLSVVLGMTYFMTGAIFNSKAFKLLSLGWWCGAIVMMVYPGFHNILIMAGMMLFFQVVPGIVMYRQAKGLVK